MTKVKQYKSEAAPKNIQQPYSFTRQLLSFKYNIYELRILTKIMEMIKDNQKRAGSSLQMDIENNVELIFPVSAFMIEGHKNHNDIRSALKSLREKTIEKQVVMEVEIDGKIEKLMADEFIGVIDNPKYAHNNSFLSLKLKDVWYLYLCDLTRGYTQYLSSVAFNCSSVETVKMYQFVNHWFKKKGKTLKITNFKEEFNIPKSYNVSKIVSRFLEPSKRELDLIGDRSFNYTFYYNNGEKRDPKKPVNGKRIDKISFTFFNNNKNKKFYELSDHEHIEAQRWIKRISTKYKLEQVDIKLLYGLIQRYSFPYFFNQEKENRKILSVLTGRPFVDKLSHLVRKNDRNITD